MPREPALLTSAGMDAEAQSASSERGTARSRASPGERKPEPTPGRRRRRESRMAAANVRRWGVGTPDPRGQPAHRPVALRISSVRMIPTPISDSPAIRPLDTGTV